MREFVTREKRKQVHSPSLMQVMCCQQNPVTATPDRRGPPRLKPSQLLLDEPSQPRTAILTMCCPGAG